MNDANSLPRRSVGCRFPLPANVRKKSLPGSTIFAQDFGASIAVVTDCGGADQNLRRSFHFCDRVRDKLCSMYTAVADEGFANSRPPSCGDVLACEVNNSLSTIDRRRLHGIR